MLPFPLFIRVGGSCLGYAKFGSYILTDIFFIMDCLDLIAMTTNPEDWPLFASELRDFSLFRDLFMSFRIKNIPRSENVRTDHLAKGTRTSGFCFSM